MSQISNLPARYWFFIFLLFTFLTWTGEGVDAGGVVGRLKSLASVSSTGDIVGVIVVLFKLSSVCSLIVLISVLILKSMGFTRRLLSLVCSE